MSIITRFMLAVSLGLFGLQQTFGLQAIYLVNGISIGFWYMRRCGCVHRIHTHNEKLCMQERTDAFAAPQS